MARWRELERERAVERVAPPRRWLAVAFLAGAALVLALGFGSDLFRSGPTEAEVNAAYRRAVEDGAAAAEAEWSRELERREVVGFSRGRSAASRVTPDAMERFRHGFTYEAAYDAAQALAEREMAAAWDAGWREGYWTAWNRIRGAPPAQAVEVRR